MMSRRYRLGGASPDRSVPEKEGPTLPLVAVCAVSSIVLSVRALPPSSSFSPCFFLFFVTLPVNEHRSTAVHFIIVRRPRLLPSKKSSQSFAKATLSSSSLKLAQPLVRILKRQSSNSILNFLLSSQSSCIPPYDPYALVADRLSWPIRRRKLIWTRSSTVCWKVSLPCFPLTRFSFLRGLGRHPQDGWGGLCAGLLSFCRPFGPRGHPMPEVCRVVGRRLVSTPSLQGNQPKGLFTILTFMLIARRWPRRSSIFRLPSRHTL